MGNILEEIKKGIAWVLDVFDYKSKVYASNKIVWNLQGDKLDIHSFFH